MQTFEALQILIFLIPGFISAILLDKILGREKKERDLAIFVEALILSFLIYVAYSLFYDSSPIYFDENKKATAVNSWWALGLLLLCSVLLPVLLGYLNHFELYMKLFRKMRITRLTGGRDTWGDVFSRKYRSININFEDGRRLHGWAELASETHEKPLIYLTHPQWIVKQDDKWVFVPINGVDGYLITPVAPIKYIEFLKRKRKEEKK